MMSPTTVMAPSTGKYLEFLKSSSGWSPLPPRLPLLHQPQMLSSRRASTFRPRAVGNISSPPAEVEKENQVRPQTEQQRSTASEDGPSTSSFKLEPTKKRPRRAQWSSGDGVGEYGGPPLDTTVRTGWAPSKRADPLASAGPYIWQKDWQSFLGAPISSEADIDSSEAATNSNSGKDRDSGFLSLSRSHALDSVDVDLSSELTGPSQAALQQQVEEARRLLRAGQDLNVRPSKVRWRFAPTKREKEYWAKGRKAATGGSDVLAREVKRAQIDPVVMAEKQRKWYAELKRNLQLTTLAIGGIGITCAYLIYSSEVAASYGAGLVGALAYIRMLGRSMDNLGAQSTAGAAKQALGSPRLLLPLILTMVYNRWNTLLVPEYGVMPLDLLPMLLGFFTYKAATMVEAAKDILPGKEQESL